MKEIIGLIAVVLTFAAYVPYFRDIIKGKTHSHIYSWGLWGLLAIILAALQFMGGAGPAAWVTVAAGIMCVGVILLSLKHGKKDITTSDTVTAVLSLVAMGFWLLADQPLIALVLVVAADLLAFVPTVRKSWNKPHTETLSLYVTNTLRFALAMFAIQEYTILSTLWPAIWVAANGLFALMLVVRRKQVKPKSA